ncbi:MAG: hypothetical protein JXM68_01910 [Sedimentisphaerales bacterium]|nr:hypothetical protein [Sedimentisphaerales bacterium]
MSELINRVDGWLNPILVKELRQSVKGRGTVIIMNLVMVILLGAMLISQGNVDVLSDRAGMMIFSIISGLLSLVCYLIIPLVLYARTSGERTLEDQDLMYITNMNPRQIILGKYATGLSLLLFYICLALPFMAFSYMFKGIDLLTILISVGSLLATSFTVVQLAVMLGAIPMKKGIGSRIGGMIFLLFFFGRGLAYPIMYATGGISPTGVSWGGMMTGKTILGLGLFVLMFNIPIFLLNIAILCPATTDRARTLRLYLSGLWLLVLTITYFVPDLAASWFIYFLLLSLFSLLTSLAGRDEIGIRLRRLIPQNDFRRNIAFLLFGGSAGGIIWSLLLAAVTVGAAMVCSFTQRNLGSLLGGDISGKLLTSGLMISGYCLLTYFISRKIRMLKSYNVVPIAAFVFMMVLSLVVTIAREVVRDLPDIWLYISPLGSFADYQAEMPLFAACFMGFSLLCVIPGLFRQYRAFKPLAVKQEESA